jgi:hypothetical protein
VQPLDPADDNFQHLTATKEFTLQNLMPYLNDLADVGFQIAGWLGMEHKFSVIRIMPGVAASPRDQLQVLLTKWLEDSEQPNAPHDWEFFIRVVRGVNKGRLAERIKKEVFKDQQEMLSGNHREEGRENEGVTGGGNSPITANLKETGELSICSAHRRSREFKSLLSIMCVCVLTHTSKSRERPAHIGEISYISHDIIKLCAERITNDWFNAGICLGMSKDELQSISESVDADTSNRNEVCCSVMLRRWLDNGDKCEKTYQKIISAEKKARGDSLLVCIEKLIDSSPPYYSGT